MADLSRLTADLSRLTWPHFGVALVIFLPSKSRSRSRSTSFATTPFDGKYQNLQKIPTNVFSLALTISVILTFKIFTLKN